MRVAYRMFRSSRSSWEQLFQQAADFATELGPDWLIGISHSHDGPDGIVTVWFWAKE